MKPNPTINDYFDLTLANYFSQNYAKSRDAALVMREKYTDQPYGYLWAFNISSQALDTVRKDSIAVPDAEKLYEFCLKDTLKYKKEYISSVRYLAGYYINTAKDRDKSLEYFTKWRDADSVNAATIQGYIDQIKKMPAPKPGSSGTPPKSSGQSKPSATTKPGTSKIPSDTERSVTMR